MRSKFILPFLILLLTVIARAQDVTFSGPAGCNGAAVSGTWTVPCDVTGITVQVYGGGGGAGGGGGGSNGGLFNTRGGGGAGGGGYTTITINVTPGSTFTYSVGGGGCGGSNGSDGSGGGNGSAGGNSTFTGTAQGGTPVSLTANGGARGTGGSGTEGSPGNGGAGGTASGGTTNTNGASGNNGSGGNGGTGGANQGPAGGAGGATTGAAGANYGGGGAGGGNSQGGAGGTGAILITFTTTIPLPATPTISSTPATCLTSGSSTISNYDNTTTYTFTPAGPTVGAGGAISGMVTGTSYTVVAGTGSCASAPSAAFSNAAATPPPAVPTVTTTAASCTANGTATITNYNAAYTYTFTPTGPTAGAGGAIANLTPGTSYTVEASDGSCSSGASNSFSVAAQLPVPVGAITGALTYCTGGNTTLTASGGASYIWASQSSGSIIGNTASVTVTQGTYAVLVTNASGCQDTVIATVTELATIPVTISGNLSYCQGGNTTLTASGGSTYIWNDAGNSTTPAITVLQGSYTVTATDANGCTGTANATVTENALPVVNITGNLNYCAGSNTTLTANGAATYQWNDAGNSTTAAITVTQGNYTVTGTGANGCTATANATVTENPLPVVAISGSLTYCTGGNTTLTASGGIGYLWSNSQTTPTVTVTQGTYSVTTTDANFCTASAQAVVTETTSLTISINGQLSYCPGSNTTLTAVGGTSYIWNDAGNSTTPSINVLQGTYAVTATDANGCTGTASATVTEATAPVITVSGTLSYCPGSNTTLTATGGSTYAWNDPANSTTASITVTQGSYTVTGTDAGGCIATATATVTENTAPTVTVSGLLTYCTGGNTTLTATGGNSYVWNDPANSTTASVTVTQGNYSVTATDANSCTGTTSVVVTESSTLQVSISGQLSICPNQPTTLTATGGTTYVWSDGSTAATFTTSAPGTYSVTATDASCTGTASASVVAISVAPLNLPDATGCQDSTITISAGNGYSSYLWANGDTTATTNVQAAGQYALTVTDANGCTVSGTLNVTTQSCAEAEQLRVFIPNAFSPNNDGNNDKFQIFASGVVYADIKVFNRWGEKVFETNNTNDHWDGTNKGERLKPGVYVYTVKAAGFDGNVNNYKGTITLIR